MPTSPWDWLSVPSHGVIRCGATSQSKPSPMPLRSVLWGPTIVQAGESRPKIGLLAWAACESDPNLTAGLKELGRIPGENIDVECRSAGGRDEGLIRAAMELTQVPVQVIVTESQPAGRAAFEATKTIPIVTIISGDPVGAGLAQSLAHPGGNLTGVTYYATELTAKRLELLKQTIPGVTRVGVLANPKVSYLPFEDDTRRAAAALGIVPIVLHVREPDDLKDTFRSMKEQGIDAVFVLPDLMLAQEAKQIAELALADRLPVMAWGNWFAEAGCLMAYSADYGSITRRLAVYVDRILKGEQPSNLPIENPSRFELSLNLHTARVLGVTISHPHFARLRKKSSNNGADVCAHTFVGLDRQAVSDLRNADWKSTFPVTACGPSPGAPRTRRRSRRAASTRQLSLSSTTSERRPGRRTSGAGRRSGPGAPGQVQGGVGGKSCPIMSPALPCPTRRGRGCRPPPPRG